MTFTIRLSEELVKASKGRLALGVLVGKIRVAKATPGLDTLFNEECKRLNQVNLELDKLPQIQALKESYAALGKNPNKFKGSNQALLERAVDPKGLYRINTVVDANNLISLQSMRSIGSYDMSKLGNEVTFRKGTDKEAYKGTTRRTVDVNNLPVLADQAGAFGSPTSDSDRALIQDSTTSLLAVIFSFDGVEKLDEQLFSLSSLLEQHSEGCEFMMSILSQDRLAETFFVSHLSAPKLLQFTSQEKINPSLETASFEEKTPKSEDVPMQESASSNVAKGSHFSVS